MYKIELAFMGNIPTSHGNFAKFSFLGRLVLVLEPPVPATSPGFGTEWTTDVGGAHENNMAERA